MKIKYIITVNQDADIDYSEDIEDDLRQGNRNGDIRIESVEIEEEEKHNFDSLRDTEYPCGECGRLRPWDKDKGWTIKPCPECGDETPF
jgi:hypothetical protein